MDYGSCIRSVILSWTTNELFFHPMARLLSATTATIVASACQLHLFIHLAMWCRWSYLRIFENVRFRLKYLQIKMLITSVDTNLKKQNRVNVTLQSAHFPRPRRFFRTANKNGANILCTQLSALLGNHIGIRCFVAALLHTNRTHYINSMMTLLPMHYVYKIIPKGLDQALYRETRLQFSFWSG